MEDPLKLFSSMEEISPMADRGVPAEFQSFMDEALAVPVIKVENSTLTNLVIRSHSSVTVNADEDVDYVIQEPELSLKKEDIEEVLIIKREEEAVMMQDEGLVIKVEPLFKNDDDDDVVQSEFTEGVKEESKYSNSSDFLAADPLVRKCEVEGTRLPEKVVQKVSRKPKQGKKLKPFKCYHCKYRCTSLSGLKVHIQSHTGEKPFACDQCDYRAGIRTHLANHKRIHTGERPFECKFCGYRAYQLGNLLEHERIHSGIRPFKCDYCDYRAIRRRHLTGHLLIHKGDKPYKCDFCDYRASNSQSLVSHVRRHTGEKPYKCKYCDYQAAQRGSLSAHEKRHTGEKPLKCDHCDFRCIQRSSLKAHVYKHTGKQPFSCYYCEFKTSYKPSLAKHLAGCHAKSGPMEGKPFKPELSESEFKRRYYKYKHKPIRSGVQITNGFFSCVTCSYTAPYKPTLVKHIKTCHKSSTNVAEDTCKIEPTKVEIQPEKPVERCLRKRTLLKQPGRFSDFFLPESDEDDPAAALSAASSSSGEEFWMGDI